MIRLTYSLPAATAALAGSCVLFLSAQPSTPAAPSQPLAANVAATSATYTGTITQFNYGPDGRVEGFVLSPNLLVSVPPDWAAQLETSAKPGDSVRVTGFATPAANTTAMRSVRAETLSLGGKTYTRAAASAPAPYTGSGVIRQLNYGPRGEVNGFVLQNGIIARTSPVGDSPMSVLKPGATISLAGMARTTPNGRTVVQVQSITANGQTIAMMAQVPPPPPPPAPGARPPRAPSSHAGGPPPPPNAPAAPPALPAPPQ